MQIDRRQLLTGAAASATLAILPARAAGPADAAAMELLDDTAETLLREYPENAAYLGIDTGARAAIARCIRAMRARSACSRGAGSCADPAPLRALSQQKWRSPCRPRPPPHSPS